MKKKVIIKIVPENKGSKVEVQVMDKEPYPLMFFKTESEDRDAVQLGIRKMLSLRFDFGWENVELQFIGRFASDHCCVDFAKINLKK